MQIFPDHERMSQAAADWLASQARSTLVRQERFCLCLCGGTTPPRAYQLLGQAELPWNRVHIFWGDERWRGEDGNHFETARPWFQAAQLHPFDLRHPEPVQAAAAYAEHLAEFFGGPPRFDVAVQGLGADGHTASLFPGSPGLLERSHWVTAHFIEGKQRWRLSLTYPALEAAQQLLFLVSGETKREALAATRGGADLPATPLIQRAQTVIYADEAAAALHQQEISEPSS